MKWLLLILAKALPFAVAAIPAKPPAQRTILHLVLDAIEDHADVLPVAAEAAEVLERLIDNFAPPQLASLDEKIRRALSGGDK